ncbi:DUF2946 family protein [Phenylobacterium sp.]|uniref:DUF2946 family protein n=1 Tax=Phenylobacterium sp. TaxID=1871053 RepID=UPI0011F828F6|nr:DUF2946 family protein [Phenylobacterium sp.]THD60444.1 MAG: DUF2946 domain-containing protein [Phenylobacterium sp.]
MPPAPNAKHDRRALAALLAVFALLVQALIPAAAAAAPGAAGALTLCTATGTTIVSAAGPESHPGPAHKGFGGLPCQDCLSAAMAAIAAAPALGVRPVAYETARVEHISTAGFIAPRARAPPRPPGQGPPASPQNA